MLSESELQSQLALNAQVINACEIEINRLLSWRDDRVSNYKYYAGFNVDKNVTTALYKDYDKIIINYKRKIAKYAKLQKALKDMLREIRWSKRRSKHVTQILEHFGMWEADIHFDDEELPGMRSNSDLIGGATDCK